MSGIEQGMGHNPEAEATEDETEQILAQHRNDEGTSDKQLADMLRTAFDNSRGTGTWRDNEQNQ